MQPVTSLAEEPQRLDEIAGRRRTVALDVPGVRPDGKQAAGEMGFLEAAGQVQAQLDKR